ncbi:T9SS type A sorting domain-containing protein [Fibrella sp. HMF5335]|uniref:T9SS type A sorting domain-containing protein n=1 Tax=Fibrella rubiginis TaxID=2817060 RepID=A0A939K763_9BACT|nr:glycosyl hydrolase family 28-related protein [Fibrella rubiginis]MBO0938290.1 T9SS type A sorting domain-containing protein [Fibrella rubiginis]
MRTTLCTCSGLLISRLSGLILLVGLLAQTTLYGQSITIRYPANSGVINIKEAPYNAKGDGVTDDYAAIQQALTDSKDDKRRTIFFPKGTYMISNTLDWGDPWRFTRIIGENHDECVIRLFDNLPAYQDKNNPKAMVYTGPDPAQRFFNSIRNLTFHTGSGNPGTAAVRFHASNEGSIEDVDIVSGDGQGVRGLDLQFSGEIGPLYVKNVYVKGFDYGVDVNALNSVTIKNLMLENQNIIGIRNLNNQLFVDGLTSTQTKAPAFTSQNGSAVLINATLTGPGSTTQTAIRTNGIYVRNIRTSGYARALTNLGGTSPTGNNLSEYQNVGLQSQFGGSISTSLKLPVRQTPVVPWGDPDSPASWANVMDYGARGDGTINDVLAVQRAIDSGAETVYFPNGRRYYLAGKIYVKATTRRITGAGLATVEGGGQFVVTTGSNPLIIQDLIGGTNNSTASVYHAGPRTLIMKNLALPYASAGCGAGDVYMEDVAVGQCHFNGQQVWAWQFNAEGDGQLVKNTGGDLWIFGMKTEGQGPILTTESKGRTELLGYTNYSGSPDPGTPIFVINEAAASFAVMYEVNFSGQTFNQMVRETRDGVTKTLTAATSSRFIGLYAGSPSPAPSSATCAAPLTAFITYPRNKDVFVEGPRQIEVQAFGSQKSISKVEYFVNGRRVGQDGSSPYSITTTLVPGDSVLVVKATNGLGEVVTAESVRITTLSQPTCAMGKGAYWEKWNDPADYNLNSIPINRAPDVVEILPKAEFINYDGNTPGSSISGVLKGFLCPPQTGLYTFYAAANEKSRLWVSPTVHPADKVFVAAGGYNGNPFEDYRWTQNPGQESAPISLEQGKLYYFESTLIMNDGEPIYVGVGWKLPDGTFQRPILGTNIINLQNLLPGKSQYYEAELAVLTGVETATSANGFTGTAYERFDSNNNDNILWTVNVAQAGTYPVNFRYSLGGTTTRSPQVRVNGQVITNIAFAPTGSASTWANAQLMVALQAGTNTIQLKAVGTGGPNLDHLRIDAPLPASGGRQGVSSELPAEALLVYPNPAHDQINIRYVSQEAGDVQISLMDLSGREVMHLGRRAEAGVNTWGVSVNDVTTGLYLVRVGDARRQQLSRVMVSR